MIPVTTKKWLTERDQITYDSSGEILMCALVDYLCSRLDAQQEVIDKLPRTADGVHVGPGSLVWSPNDCPNDGLITSCAVSPFYEWRNPNPQFAPCHKASGGSWAVYCCYSTLAAAESARTGEGRG